MRTKQQEQDVLLVERAKQNGVAFSLFALFLSISFLAAVPVAMKLTNTNVTTLWQNFFQICTSPSKLVTDYFSLGCLASTLFNAAICGLAANALIFFSKVKAKATALAGYMLVIAHGFYGLNFLNMWPPLLKNMNVSSVP